MTKPFSLVFLAVALGSSALAQNNAFAPPRATLHYSPDRTCDLIHVDVDIDIDYPNRTYSGTTTNTLAPLRNGLKEIVLHAGKALTISKLEVDGKPAKYDRKERDLIISIPGLVKGKQFKVAITYAAKDSQGRSFGGGGGFHWIEPRPGVANREGFWTQGESEYNSEWAPTWDYPNDLATSETHCTVQSDWDVIGNGVLTGTKLSADKKRKTFDWKMSQPHATYLLTLCGGPFDIKKDKWEGVDLWYVVPKGEGYLIDDSFGHTKDMLTYFSKVLGVKYAWPKYAQNAMFDFGGGMENVSATTLGEGSLTESRDGYYTMDSLNSHELAHQWFGDLVTCYNWGDAWLNESFATFMQILYFEHSRGQDAYDWEIDDAMRSYFAEARRYKRPISTKLYPNGDAMFDSHTYPKGGVVLHSLRKMLGDEEFFGSLNAYLTKWRHTPVESAQLRRAFTEYTGINAEPFWAQWLDKPGHPVLDYVWEYANGKVKLTVKQLQDTADGTPIYDIPAKVDLISTSGQHTILDVHLTQKEETFELPSSVKPGAVVLDPRHEFLRQIQELHWAADELPLIFQYGLNAPDRSEAMKRILDGSPSDATLKVVASVLAKDNGVSPAFRSVFQFANMGKPEFRAFWLEQLNHKNFMRQAQAVSALAKLPQDQATTAKLKALINDKAPIQVVVASINALAAWDSKGNAALFEKAAQIKDRRGRIARAANQALGKE